MYSMQFYHYQDHLSKTLTGMTTNLDFILKYVSDKETSDLEEEIKNLSDETLSLKNSVLDISELYLPTVHKAVQQMGSKLKSAQISMSQIMKDAKKYSSESHTLRKESKALKTQSTKQGNSIKAFKLQLLQKNEQVCSLQEQLSQERSMCTSIGSTLTCMLWRACRNPEVVNSMLTWYKFPEFLRMAAGTLESFTNTYILESKENSIPVAGSEEGHFVAGMTGIVTNMSATPSGREMLLNSEHGQQLLVYMLETLTSIPPYQGDYLRRLILMTIYNVIIEEVGLNFLVNLEGFSKALGKNILNQEEECLTLCLHILTVYTASIPSLPALSKADHNIPTEDVKRIAEAERGENSMLALDIMKNLKKIKHS